MIWVAIAGFIGNVTTIVQFILMVLGVPCLWLAIKALKKYLNS